MLIKNIHPIYNIFTDIIKNGYEEDFCPYTANDYLDNYCYEYTFSEWYFLYRKNKLYSLKKLNKKLYFHTPTELLIGNDILFV